MRRFSLPLALSLVLAACGGSSVDSSASAITTTTAPPATTSATAPPVEPEIVETTAPVTTTTASPAEAPTTTAPAAETTSTTVVEAAANAPYEILANTPPDVFDSYVSTMAVSMGFDGAAFEITGAGAWVDGSFECSMGMDIAGFAFTQSVIATSDAVWFDDGTGYRESTVTSAVTDVLASCPASPLFWSDFVDAGLKPIGDAVEFAGRKAIKVDLTELLDYSGSLGIVPEIQDAGINAMDMWVDVETNVVLGLYADIAMDPAALGDLGMPSDTTTDAIVMTMDLRIDQINDPTIKIATPGGYHS